MKTLSNKKKMLALTLLCTFALFITMQTATFAQIVIYECQATLDAPQLGMIPESPSTVNCTQCVSAMQGEEIYKDGKIIGFKYSVSPKTVSGTKINCTETGAGELDSCEAQDMAGGAPSGCPSTVSVIFNTGSGTN